MDNDLICIGKIVSFHGLRGEVKALPYTDFPERIFDLENVRVKEQEKISILEIESVRIQGRFWVIQPRGIFSRETADFLKGKEIYILPEEKYELPPGHYYHDDILGLEVYSYQGGFIGIVKDILPAGGQDTFAVAVEGKSNPLLVPASKDIIIKIDIINKRMDVKLPEGIWEL